MSNASKRQSSTTPLATASAPPQTGSDTDGLIGWMRRFHIPITRKNYLNLAYMGEVPEELSAEEEANLPPEVRLHRG